MRFCEKKEVGPPHNFNMGGTYSTDILRSLYDQGVPDRSRWVQEAGNTFLAQIRLLRIGQNWLEKNT